MYVFLTDHGLLAVVNGWIDERNCDEDSCGCSCLVVTVLHVGFFANRGLPVHSPDGWTDGTPVGIFVDVLG